MTLLAVVTALVGGLVWILRVEYPDWGHRVARVLIRAAARCRPVSSRDRWRREWLAELASIPRERPGATGLTFAAYIFLAYGLRGAFILVLFPLSQTLVTVAFCVTILGISFDNALNPPLMCGISLFGNVGLRALSARWNLRWLAEADVTYEEAVAMVENSKRRQLRLHWWFHASAACFNMGMIVIYHGSVATAVIAALCWAYVLSTRARFLKGVEDWTVERYYRLLAAS